MRSRSNSSSTERKTDRSQTIHPKRDPGHRPNQLFVVGIGPGDLNHLTKRAIDVLASVDVVAGYTTYIDLIRPLIEDKKIISTGMTKEVKRVEAAIEQARDGRSCAIVSSGDPGIYAMAGLVLETCKIKNIKIAPPGFNTSNRITTELLQVEVVPGIPALCSGASLLGAPLSHDFAAISLSDLLTPWEVIEKRIEAAAKADFVIVLYNPKSKKRTWQLERAQQIMLTHRDNHTPVGIVVSAMRSEQDVRIVPLSQLHEVYVDMQTTVFVGSSQSSQYLDFMITPRGYAQKYKIADENNC
jgi:precorrin-3B C17-methyltransferase